MSARDPRRDMPLIFELSTPGRLGCALPDPDVPVRPVAERVPAHLLRETPPALPEVSELDVVRHYTRLSHRNFSIDEGMYPLGSCTMKYNPKIHEDLARLPGFCRVHPYTPPEHVQGALRLMWELERVLAEISGMDRVTFHPAAGAHGELVGMLMIRAYFRSRGEARTRVIVPDSAHGTNPATAAMCGYQVVTVRSDARGNLDVGALRDAMDESVAALMLTNPNTLGLFEERILEIAEVVHSRGGQMYLDGANFNAMLGVTRPGDQGFDVMHMNLHKTFSTPHGGGGPGAGAVGVKAHLVPFLPVPTVERRGDGFVLDEDRPQSVGRVRAFYGNFANLVRAYAYIRSLGAAGLRQVAETAVLNANYLAARLREHFDVPYPRRCMHEFVLSGARQKRLYGVATRDMAKRILDYGFHAPTVYFPLIVEEAIMIEPTETESKRTLDEFAEALIAVAREARDTPDVVRTAPHTTPVRRLDEVRAARQPDLRWRPRRDEPVPGAGRDRP
ncbi:MAG: aminomethyl-transferring glycine dehydrogenase subunit GcvPB [Armatimonadota bacterium]|nr:aminomethyl-transferring glycine dehydrogenase subunit GcvPB [Armatimonadota bacterium]MDR7403259.1 aminomethyl-transferring glycine dehydrogenase subunit GcvPB [Armatimonadota bacterium]MDR7508296.1 aminomethyl-transferring glycine dehydrogenase subunit GcvPB [Armatimonadota bacterium]MDR7515901.1 aminomethyl-transferring glycine dehydrogenase subunit GcvPB [Armatimonadota bacterium]MDR7560821.1 aminomethyl-transferring glycine dehydrogenase subunit GcvPB [Armatimonadota bacterium]